MANWRALITAAASHLSDATVLTLALTLGALTVVPLMLVWRGFQSPRSAEFPVLVVALLLATILASFHSHRTGAVLLIVPLITAFAESRLGRPQCLLVVFGCVCRHWC